MKDIVAKIFGKEASEDQEIVAFYEDVQKIAMEEYAIEYHQKQVKDNEVLDIVMLSAFNKYCNEWGTYNNHGDNLWYEYSPLEAHHKLTRTHEQMLIEFKKLHSA